MANTYKRSGGISNLVLGSGGGIGSVQNAGNILRAAGFTEFGNNTFSLKSGSLSATHTTVRNTLNNVGYNFKTVWRKGQGSKLADNDHLLEIDIKRDKKYSSDEVKIKKLIRRQG